ncbi:hypothetical protein GCM10012285_29920 [Streptomyces kronopolitis]|uniref:Lipoprotein n=1 Tax=Streptomyces kronopolitis TaxID=1612435 RepID=A0ABQ2JH58_9ACTN|nr:hypothetical protein GCM10012285_29920 [Streptomyces kronopolitis]
MLAGASCWASPDGERPARGIPPSTKGARMGKHGDGKGGTDGDKQQSPKESDGRWTKPVTDPPKK